MKSSVIINFAGSVGFILTAILLAGCQDKGRDVAAVNKENNIYADKKAGNREIEEPNKEKESEKLTVHQDGYQEDKNPETNFVPLSFGDLYLQSKKEERDLEKIRKEKDELNQKLLEQQKQILKQEEKKALPHVQEAEKLRSAASIEETETENIDSSNIEMPVNKDEKSEDTEEEEFTKKTQAPVLKFAPDFNGDKVPVWVWFNKKKANSSIVLHVLDKKTGRNFLWPVKDLEKSKSSAGRFIFLVPGEYTFRAGTGISRNPNNLRARQQVRGPLVPMSFPRAFKVEEEPVTEIEDQKVHAVLTY